MKPARKSSSGNSRDVPLLAALAFGCYLLAAPAAGSAALRAELDHDTVQEGDTLALTIESDAAQSGERPDVTPLRKDFDVLGTSTSSETKIVNGSRSDRTRWLVQLQPRHSGIIDIPPITLGSEHTPALEINVTAPAPQSANQASKHVLLEVDTPAAGQSIYVQQQIPYTVRLYYDDSVQTGELVAPDPTNAIVEQLGQEKRYAATHLGRAYNVIERRYAIAPERSGALRIPAASFRGTAVVAQSRLGDADPADDLMARLLRNMPFANDPLFKGSFGAGMALGDTSRPVAARSGEFTLEVQPRPAAAQGKWLPAEQITLHDSWEDKPPQLKAGEPATRTITIDAKGLAASQIPSLSLAQPGNARLYPEAADNHSRTDGDAIYGISKQNVTYIPTAQGTLDIPPVELDWWNTRTNAQSRAVLPAHEFKIAPGAAGARSNAASPAPASALPQATPAAPPSTAGQPLRRASLAGRLQDHRVLLGAGAALLMMAILSLAAIGRWRYSGFKSGQGAAPAVPVPRQKSAMRALQQACVGNDRRAAADALMELARSEWPDDPPRGLCTLATRLEAGGEEVSRLDRSLYAAGESRWEGAGLWAAIRGGLQLKRSETLREDDGLDALYLQ